MMVRKWHLEFLSVLERPCHVFIYTDEDYTGDIIELTGADNPFYVEDDNSDDMLHVFRYKTGYLRLIENTENELSDLYAPTAFSRYMEVSYHSQTIFEGYIQVTGYSNEWVGCPRVLQFPIVSALGLLGNQFFDPITTPRDITLGEALYTILHPLHIQYVVFPDVDINFSGSISSLVISPYNDDFSPAPLLYTPVFSGIDHQTFIEALCNAFGWVVHEEFPLTLVFSQYDYDGQYAYYNVRDLAYQVSKQVRHAADYSQNVDDYFEIASNKNKQDVVLPKRRIILNYDGEYVKSCSFDFGKLTFSLWNNYSNMFAAWLHAGDDPQIDGTYVIYNNAFNSSNGHLSNYGVCPAKCGTRIEQKERIIVNVNPEWVSWIALFSLHFYQPPTSGNFVLSFTQEWGNTIANLGTDGETDHYGLLFTIRVGDMYYQGAGIWGATEPNPGPLSSSGTLDVENAPAGAVHIKFYLNIPSTGDPVDLVSITDVKLQEEPFIYSDYEVYKSKNDIFGNGEGIDDQSVSLMISPYRVNTNMIGSSVHDYFTNYRYMLKPMDRLQVTFRVTDFLPSDFYTSSWAFWQNGWKWRIVAVDIYPWDDEVRLTLHHSEYLD